MAIGSRLSVLERRRCTLIAESRELISGPQLARRRVTPPAVKLVAQDEASTTSIGDGRAVELRGGCGDLAWTIEPRLAHAPSDYPSAHAA